MAIISESPWYQQIWQEGEQRGMQQGMQQGIISGIETGLELKFGAEGLELLPEIAQISDLERLKSIQREVMTANNLEQVRQIL